MAIFGMKKGKNSPDTRGLIDHHPLPHVSSPAPLVPSPNLASPPQQVSCFTNPISKVFLVHKFSSSFSVPASSSFPIATPYVPPQQGNAGKRTFFTSAFVDRATKRMRAFSGVTITPTPSSSAAPRREPILTITPTPSSTAAPRREPILTRSSAMSSATLSSEEFSFSFPKDFGFAAGQSMWPYLSHLRLEGIPELKGKSLEEHLQESAVNSFKVTLTNLHALDMLSTYERRMLEAEGEGRRFSSKVGELSAEVEKLRKMADDLDLKLKEASAREAAGKGMVADLTAQLYEKSSQLEESQEQMQRSQEQLVRKKEQLLAAGRYFTFMARIECMEEHTTGKSSEWDLAAEKRALEEAFPEKPDFSMPSMPDCPEDQDMEDVTSKASPD